MSLKSMSRQNRLSSSFLSADSAPEEAEDIFLELSRDSGGRYSTVIRELAMSV